MRNCSESYKQQINKELRNKSHVKIIIYDEDYSKETHSGTVLLEINTSDSTASVPLKSCTYTQEIEPINSKLPTNSLSFTFFDLNKTFNPENADSSWEKLNRPLPVALYFGYVLDNSSIEWIKMSVFVTKGENSWSIENKKHCSITVSAESVIGYMDNDLELLLNSGKMELDTYQKALQALEKTTGNIYLKKWFTIIIPDTSKSLGLYKSLTETLKEKEFLQLIAQGMSMELCTDSNGDIQFKQHCENAFDFNLNFEKMLAIPTCKQYPVLSDLNISYRTPEGGEWYHDPDDDTANVKIYVPAATSDDEYWPQNNEVIYSFKHEVYDYYFVPRSGGHIRGSSLIDSSHIGNFVRYVDSDGVIHQGEVFLAPNRKDIMGQLYRYNMEFVRFQYSYRELSFSEKPTVYTHSSSVYGSPCTIENPLITTEEAALSVQSEVLKYLTLRSKCENVDYRGNPELEAGDLIHAQTMYSDDINVLVTKNVIKYNGTLSGQVDFFLYPNDDEEVTNDI